MKQLLTKMPREVVLRSIAVLALAFLHPLLLCAQTVDSRLTVTDVEKVIGLKGIRRIKVDSSPASGRDTIDFTASNGKNVLSVTFYSAEDFDDFKNPHVIDFGGAKTTVNTNYGAVPGLGDEAFHGKATSIAPPLHVKKGTQAFSLVPFVSRNQLTFEQVKALARIILSRTRAQQL